MVVFLCIPCLVLLAYFGVMGIFFPKYRRYIREGWRCFIDKLRGKKCSVSFDNRMRMAFSMWLAKRGMVRAGKFFGSERNFNAFLIFMAVASTILTIYLVILFIQFQITPPCDVGSSCSVNVTT
ncbi:MAG: hypothetical protein V1813_01500 [Candidatus Aenigmatarchaeota archaeon]